MYLKNLNNFLLRVIAFFSLSICAQTPSHIVSYTPEELKISQETEKILNNEVELRALSGLTLPMLVAKYRALGFPDEMGQFFFAVKLFYGLGIPEANPKAALKIFLKIAPEIKEVSQIVTYMCNRNSCDFEVLQQGVAFLKNKAAQGSSNSFLLLYELQKSNMSFSDLKRDIKTFVTQVGDEHPELLYRTAWAISGIDRKDALDIMYLLESKKYVPALLALAEMYEEGNGFGGRKININMKRALEYYQRAADLGSKLAVYRIGRLYLAGNGVPQDTARAFKLIKEAADAMEPVALYDMGVFYLSGHGVEKNDSEAINYFKKADSLGERDASTALGVLAQAGMQDDGSLAEPDYDKAYPFFKRAYDQEDCNAAFYLAYYYQIGLNVPIDHERAQALYNEALASKTPECALTQGRMYEYGIGTEIDLQKARSHYQKAIAEGSPFLSSYLEGVDRKIAATLIKMPEVVAEDIVETPDVPVRTKVMATAVARVSRQQRREQAERDRRRSLETNFQKQLNEKFPSDDGSEIEAVNFEDGQITVLRPSDNTKSIIMLPEAGKKRRLRKAKKLFDYLPRVQKWFDDLKSQNELDRSHYKDMIRHAFPQKVDVLAKLFGDYTVDKDGRFTLSVSGELIPGRTQQPISGNYMLGYEGNNMYHRFLHTNV